MVEPGVQLPQTPPSSMVPSQSSSLLLQVSAVGSTSPVQMPSHLPPLHDSVPALQAPTPLVLSLPL